jgi:hypothetical protein
MRTAIAALTVATLITILASCSSAQAAPTRVNVRIEGKTETLFEGPIWTEGHDVEGSSDTQERSCDGINVNDPQNLTPGPTPTAASVDAMSLIGETFDGQWYGAYEDYFITRWGPDSEEGGMSWGLLVNNVFTDVGGCQYELGTGDEVLWAYNAFGGGPFLAMFPVDVSYGSGTRPLTAVAELGKPFEVEVVDYTDDHQDVPPAAPERTGSGPFAGADVSPVKTSAKGFEKIETESPETVKTNANGKASITFTEPGWHRIKATAVSSGGEEDVIRSNRLDVCVPEEGETGCGEPPAEDPVRTPPYLEDRKREEEAKRAQEAKHHEEEIKREEEARSSPPTAGANTTGEDADTAADAPGTTPTTTDTASPVARLAGASINPSGLLLKFTAAGKATVTIAQQVGTGRHARWRTVKQITVRAGRAGTVKVKLPRLPAGRYRVTISLPHTRSVVKMLTVTHTRS